MTAPPALRADLAQIASLVPPGARVLDVGCGAGDLLHWLATHKGCDARGIELSRAGVSAAVARGLSVVQGDADTDLIDYPTGCFDVVVLSQTVQATRQPDDVIRHLVRIGARAVVSFPNFGHWRARAQLTLGGRMPMTRDLPAPWYATENIHLCTITDFEQLAQSLGVRIVRALYLRRGQPLPGRPLANLLADTGLFELARG